MLTRLVTVTAALGAILAIAPAAVHAEEEDPYDTTTTVTVIEGDAAARLAERYAPIVAIQAQPEECGAGEPYYPADVSVILDQPDVVLLDGQGGTITAPDAKALFEAPQDSNFDLPGDSLRPGCDFERRFGWRTGGEPVQYARVVRDSADPGRIIVQYWEYFVYNQWNNLHESDWESALVVFDATSPDEALAKGPTMMSLSQHYGNERRAWNKVQRRGDRPVIYPAAGSHAIFYEQRTWFGMDGDAGFGCDSTLGPSTELDPRVVVLPPRGTADNGFGWMEFRGRWGERQRISINDSEPGPQYTRQWRTPVAYIQSGRDGAISVPQVDFAGVTSFFCSATTQVSAVMNHLMSRPLVFWGIVIGGIVCIVLLARRTRWRHAQLEPLRARRHAGHIITAAVRLVLDNPRRFLPASLLALSGGVVATMLQRWIIEHTPLDHVIGDGQRGGPTGALIALAAGALQMFAFVVLALVVGLYITHGLTGEREPKPIRAAIRSREFVPMLVLAVTLVLTGPFALYLVPMLAAAPAAALAEQRSPMSAFRRSALLWRSGRWRVFLITSTAISVALFLAPLLGVAFLLVFGTAFWGANMLAGVPFSITVPALAAAAYLLWADLAARFEEPTPVQDAGS